MSKFIDPICVITNGILTGDSKLKIIDPLGYYCILIESEIVPKPPQDGLLIGGGAGFPATRKKRRIRLRVNFFEEGIDDFEAEFYLDNFHLDVTNVNLIDNEENIEVKIGSVKFKDYEKIIKIKVK